MHNHQHHHSHLLSYCIILSRLLVKWLIESKTRNILLTPSATSVLVPNLAVWRDHVDAGEITTLSQHLNVMSKRRTSRNKGNKQWVDTLAKIYLCVCFLFVVFNQLFHNYWCIHSFIGQCSQRIIHSFICRGRMPSRKVLNFRHLKTQLLVFGRLRNRDLVFQNLKNSNKTSKTPACKQNVYRKI